MGIDPRWVDDDVFIKWGQVGCISMLLFFLNWCLIFIFGVITFRLKKLHLSANNDAKLEKLNKFYSLRDKMEEEESNNLSKSKMLLKDTKSNGLKTPLLAVGSSSNGHTVGYMDDDQLRMSKRNLFATDKQTQNGMIESMDSMDGVPTLLSAFSEDGKSEVDKVSAMMNWDKTPNRSTRGMSEVTFSQKRKPKHAKKASVDSANIVLINKASVGDQIV